MIRTRSSNGEDSSTELDVLRQIIVGPEKSRLDDLTEKIEAQDYSSRHIAERLPEAIALSASRDDQLGRALSPTIDTALRESIRREPREIATAIFPILGPAIRKAIAEAMSGLVRSINNAVEQSLSIQGLKWRIEAWRSGVPYPEVVLKHALVYRVEQAFLIHADTGLLLEHAAAANLVTQEAELVSGMLSAIQDFVRDSFSPGEGATLRTFSVGDHTVQVEAGPRALLALVIKGEAPHSLLEKQQDTLETIHLEFATQLAEFNGDPRPLAPVRRLLEDCIETVLTTDQARAKRKGAWLKWAIPLALLVTALLAFYVRSTIRWNRAVNALRATPGLVVLNADRDWGTWKITGLKDPLARDPRAVIATSDVGRPDVDATWLGYMSLDPTMVHVRAVHSFDSLTKVLERGRILFATGSAQLDPAAIVEIGSAASLIRRLDEIAENLNGVTRVGLTGRTDFTGADTTNATLAAQRVTAVSDYLVSLGIQRERLLPDPVATSKPLVAVSEDERARINRSVSFSVSLSVAPPPGGIQ